SRVDSSRVYGECPLVHRRTANVGRVAVVVVRFLRSQGRLLGLRQLRIVVVEESNRPCLVLDRLERVRLRLDMWVHLPSHSSSCLPSASTSFPPASRRSTMHACTARRTRGSADAKYFCWAVL